jgi:hypothetical protein
MAEQVAVLQRLLSDDEGLSNALAVAVASALRRHQRRGNQVPVWRSGEPVWVAPDELLVDFS